MHFASTIKFIAQPKTTRWSTLFLGLIAILQTGMILQATRRRGGSASCGGRPPVVASSCTRLQRCAGCRRSRCGQQDGLRCQIQQTGFGAARSALVQPTGLRPAGGPSCTDGRQRRMVDRCAISGRLGELAAARRRAPLGQRRSGHSRRAENASLSGDVPCRHSLHHLNHQLLLISSASPSTPPRTFHLLHRRHRRHRASSSGVASAEQRRPGAPAAHRPRPPRRGRPSLSDCSAICAAAAATPPEMTPAADADAIPSAAAVDDDDASLHGSVRRTMAAEVVTLTRMVARTRDAIFRKITNRNQTNTNEIATTETKYQTDFYTSEKIPIFNQILYRSYSKYR